MQLFGIALLEKACRANSIFFLQGTRRGLNTPSLLISRPWFRKKKENGDNLLLLFVPSLNVSHLCSTVPALRLVVCALVLSNRSSLSCPELSLMIKALVLSVLCLEYLGSLWVVHFNLHWQPRSFFFWDVISPTLNTQLEGQVLRYICPLPCDLPSLVKPPRSVSPCRDSSQSHWGNQATPPSQGNSTLASGYHNFSFYAPFCTEWSAHHPAFSRQLPF